jgi:hypothetical protein
MNYGICNLNAVPMRLESDHRSEMINQLLFGEIFKILESKSNWVKISSDFDNVEGWIEKGQFLNLEESEFENLKKKDLHLSSDFVDFIVESNNQNIPISIGSHLFGLKQNKFQYQNELYTFDGANVIFSEKEKSKIVNNSLIFLNSPFLHGGKSIMGIDASGLIQIVYKLNGLKLPRSIVNQAQKGEVLSFIEEAEAGDLAFFDNEEGEIIHGGIILDNNLIIHSYGKVRVDILDSSGIFNPELKRHSHKLRLIRRIC